MQRQQRFQTSNQFKNYRFNEVLLPNESCVGLLMASLALLKRAAQLQLHKNQFCKLLLAKSIGLQFHFGLKLDATTENTHMGSALKLYPQFNLKLLIQKQSLLSLWFICFSTLFSFSIVKLFSFNLELKTQLGQCSEKLIIA